MNSLNIDPKNSIHRSPVWRAFLLVAAVLACFALSPAPNAFGVSPAPDGGYPNGNTAEGDNALLSLTTGIENTAIGGGALSSDTSGDSNTGVGAGVLGTNVTGRDNTAIGHVALINN